MERLSEELLDHIVSEVINPLPSKHRPFYDDVISLSVVSRKFRRIAEPHIYRSLVLDEDHDEILLQIMSSRPELLRYVRAVSAMVYSRIANGTRDFIMCLPNLKELDLDIDECALSEIVPVLKLQTVTKLRLSGVVAREIEDWEFGGWGFENNTLTSLDLSFIKAMNQGGSGDNIRLFAAVFRSLTSLKIRRDLEPGYHAVLDGPAFQYLVYSFKHAFETTLRKFSFWYEHSENSGHLVEEDDTLGGNLGARDILRESRLEKLKIDTICLQKPKQTTELRSLTLGPSCLPTSLRTLYMRHIVATGNLNPEEKNLMHSDEAQCLSQLVNLAARRLRFPHLRKLTLAIALPPIFEDVASRVVKIQARKVKVQLDLMFMSEWDHVSHSIYIAWPKYDRTRDPRDPSYDYTRFRYA